MKVRFSLTSKKLVFPVNCVKFKGYTFRNNQDNAQIVSVYPPGRANVIIMEENEYDLVKSLSRGNVLAFNTLFRKYGSRLYYFAYGYLKSEPESEELVQEVFTKIWERRGDLKEDLSFRSYLFTIAFNRIKKHFRRQAYLAGYIESGLPGDIDMNTVHEIYYDSLKIYVNDLVKRLPDRRREIFIKSRFEGLSISEIADDMKISHKTVENQLTQALKYLRLNLSRETLPTVLFGLLFVC